MSDDNSKVGDKASELAKNIWLAGVGAYGRAADEAQARLEKAGVETPKLFRDLVKAGATLEEEARNAFSVGQGARNSVEERIARVRENFNLQRLSRSDELQALHEKIDRLTDKVEQLSQAIAESGGATAKKKAAPRKKAAAKKKSATRKKATAKKSSSGSQRS
ncbi:phasin family protein [Parahaliea sp. F7430]|uniref:Phasin family protein n=1 Tax=Sediminihaliea albiluteola TaxID=2758564 RepID=A0A7W2TWI9_9GAMM|nr:phasin family protein [Sediminihaliea albiluteola]MBA6413258.1 phasin family protein [Sediminihaliea albiluteola]